MQVVFGVTVDREGSVGQEPGRHLHHDQQEHGIETVHQNMDTKTRQQEQEGGGATQAPHGHLGEAHDLGHQPCERDRHEQDKEGVPEHFQSVQGASDHKEQEHDESEQTG